MTVRVRFRWRNSRPEQRWLSREVSLLMDGTIDAPFRVLDGQTALVHPSSLAHPTATAVLMRHALELALWTRLAGKRPRNEADQLTIAILVARVAALYWRGLPQVEQEPCLAALPDWLAAAYAMLAAADALSPQHATEAVLTGQDLFRLGVAPTPGPVRDTAGGQRVLRRLGELGEIAAPAEHLLVSGGGDRLTLDPATGLNKYGAGATPRPDALAFASSTASSISQQAYDEVERLRQTLIRRALRGRLHAGVDTEFRRIRQRLVRSCSLRGLDGLEVILTSSGTDAEYAALHLARRKPTNRLLNLLVAPEETGSGVPHAAAGRHFGTVAPHGAPTEPGAPVEGLRPDLIAVATVPLRDASGAPRRVAQIDAEVADQVRHAVDAGQRCLIHLLDASKTGLRAPSLAAIQALRARFEDMVEVVVDACQLRLGPDLLRRYLESGFMVLLTGSKFAMGPPFSGALLVPQAIAARIDRVAPLPHGLGGYWTRAAWPQAWRRLTDTLPERPDLGLLLRWQAALWELDAFHAVPAKQRATIFATLAETAQDAISRSSLLELVPSFSPDGDPGGDHDLPTIFTFRLVRRAPGGRGQPLDFAALGAAHRWLNEDLSAVLPTHVPDSARRLAATACHLGQPVRIGAAGGGALRLCFGAHTVFEVAFDLHLGQTLQQRLDLQVDRILSALKKAELIAKYYDQIRLRLEPRPARAARAG